MAITVLAGSNLLAPRTSRPGSNALAPFLEGVVTLAWATATFWFPLMVAIGVWRHIVRPRPAALPPAYWALVFPLGMYGAATYRMRGALHLDALGWLPGLVFAIALTAWLLTFVVRAFRGDGRRGRSRGELAYASSSAGPDAGVHHDSGQ